VGLGRTPLRKGVIHGDFYRRNILWRARRVVALIDWHDARIAPFWDEVASAAWEMAHDRHRFLPDRAAAFLRAYGPHAPSLELAAPLLRVRLRDQVRYALARARHGEPLDESVNPCLRAYTELRDFRPPAMQSGARNLRCSPR
jgi:Ser/Thr protein kinase RdoA (MazF antagonist)